MTYLIELCFRRPAWNSRIKKRIIRNVAIVTGIRTFAFM